MTLYKKSGRRYIPVREYDPEAMDAMPFGFHLLMVRPGSKTIKFNVAPEYHKLYAAAMTMQEAMVSAMFDKEKFRPIKRKLTKKEAEAWENLKEAMGSNLGMLERASVYEIVEAGIEALLKEAKTKP